MKKPYSYIFLLSLLFTASAHASASQAEKNQAHTIVAEINGTKLTIADFQAYIKMRLGENKRPQELNQAQRQKIFGQYINRELLYQEAIKKGLDKNATVSAEIEKQRRNIVVSYALKQLMQIPPKESDMQSEYKKVLLALGKEYKARHILVKTEQEAAQIIVQLDNGKNFIQLAMQHSIDASAKKGGELGWFSNQQMVKPFIAATKRLSNGNYTRTPINTRFGWHIIRLDGTRDIPSPSYDEMEKTLIIRINNRRISAYLTTLRKKASITIAKQSERDETTATASTQ